MDSDRRNEARRLKETAVAIEDRCTKLLNALGQGIDVADQAVRFGYLHLGAPYAPVIVAELAGPPEPEGNRWSMMATGRAVFELRERARFWRRRAHADSLDSRGRKVSIRRSLAIQVAMMFREHGLACSRGADGDFARVLGIVYDAGRFPVPMNMSREVAAVLDDLEERRVRANWERMAQDSQYDILSRKFAK